MNIFELKSSEYIILNYLAGFASVEELPEDMQARILPEGAEEENLDAIYEILAELDSERGYKLDYLARIYKNSLALAEALKAEKMAIAKRQSAAETKAERLKALMAMLLTDNDGNVSKYESAAVKITTRKSENVDFEKGFDVETLPDQFMRIKREVNREALKKAIKAGEAVPEGVFLAQNTNLIIK